MEEFLNVKVSWPWPWPWIGSHGIPSSSTHRPLHTCYSNRTPTKCCTDV